MEKVGDAKLEKKLRNLLKFRKILAINIGS